MSWQTERFACYHLHCAFGILYIWIALFPRLFLSRVCVFCTVCVCMCVWGGGGRVVVEADCKCVILGVRVL